jgi:hypothetical protein
MKVNKFLLLSLSLFLSLASVSAAESGDFTGDYHALFIAVDNYESKVWTSLRNPVNDAKALQTVLKNKYGFVQTTTLFNEQATRVKILETVDKITAELKAEDKLLIFYSGHGIVIGEDGYWVPFEAKSQERYELLPTNEIKTALGKSPSKHILLMIDACFSSTILKSAEAYPNDGQTTYYERMESLASRQAITAGGLEPVADGEGENSIFVKYILKFLQKNEQKQIDAAELFELIKYPIVANSPNTPQFGHIQNTGHEGGQFVFRLKEERLCDSPVYFEEGEIVKFDKDGGTLHAKTTFKNVKYQWSYNSETIAHEGPDLPIKRAGMYGVTIITEDGDCSNSAIAEVEIVMPKVIIDVLEGFEVEYDRKGIVNAALSGYDGAVVYEWKRRGFLVSNKASAEVAESGIYTVTVKLPDGRMLGEATVNVTIKEQVYVVQLGDNMERIARKLFNDPNKAILIYNANPQIEVNSVLKAGQEIIIPGSIGNVVDKKVNIATNTSFAPFSASGYYNGGMITDIVNAVYKKMGTTTEINYLPSNQVKGVTYSGRFEVGYPFIKNADDELMFLYSEPIYSALIVFFAKADSEVEDMETTVKKRMKKGTYMKLVVGVPLGFMNDKLMQYYNEKYIALRPYPTIEACFEAMQKGELDLVAAPQMSGLVAIQNTEGLNRADFKILGKSIDNSPMHLVVSKQHPEAEAIVLAFNKALAEAKAEGLVDKIIKAHIDLIQSTKP